MTATIQEAACETKEIPIHQIQTDGTQSRAAMNQETIDDYAELITKDVAFEPLVVFSDGTTYWLADGHHRLAAAKRAGYLHRWCKVHEGTKRDALRYSLKANITHGLRRTNADKRHAVGLVLADEEWRRLSSPPIADMCGVSHTFVDKVRAEAVQPATVAGSIGQPESEKRLGADGKWRQAPKALSATPAVRDDTEPANVKEAEEEDDTPQKGPSRQGKGIRAQEDGVNREGKLLAASVGASIAAAAAFGKLTNALAKIEIKSDLDKELDAILDAISKSNDSPQFHNWLVTQAWYKVDDDASGKAA